MASDGACDGPQYTVHSLRRDGSRAAWPTRDIRAVDARRVARSDLLCTIDGLRTMLTPAGGGPEATALVIGYPTGGTHRSRLAVSMDGEIAYSDGDRIPMVSLRSFASIFRASTVRR